MEINIRENLWRHRKLEKLLLELPRVRRPTAVGHLYALWRLAMEERRSGVFRGYSDAELERAMEWTGDKGALVAALRKVRFLDGPSGARRIHNWRKHNNGKYVLVRLPAEKERQRELREAEREKRAATDGSGGAKRTNNVAATKGVRGGSVLGRGGAGPLPSLPPHPPPPYPHADVGGRASLGRTERTRQANPRARATNPRSKATNPRALEKPRNRPRERAENPRAIAKAEARRLAAEKRATAAKAELEELKSVDASYRAAWRERYPGREWPTDEAGRRAAIELLLGEARSGPKN